MFSLAAPMFLWGLAALALPVLAHLINRETRRRLDFPSLRFLRQSKLPQTGRRMPRDLLLLLLRLALLALIILALAQPRWTPPLDAAAVPSNQREQVAIVLDNSASMGGWGTWQRAQDRLEEILRERAGADFAFVASARGPGTVIPLTGDPAAITQAARGETPSLAAGSHRESIRTAAGLLTGTGRKSIYLISDFQQTDWQEAAPLGWDSSINVDFVDIGPADDARENLAIMSARAVPLAEDGKRVLAEVRNFGAQSATARVTSLVGTVRQEGETEVEPGATRSLVFDMKTEPGSDRGIMRLSTEDPYAPDNELYFWAGDPPALPMLAVTASGQNPRTSSLVFLQAALGVRAQPSWLTFVTAPMEANLFYPRDLEGARGVLLLGSAGEIPRDALPALRTFVEEGGVLLATPGRDAALNFRALADAGLVDVAVRGEERMNPGDRPFRIAPIRAGNPMLDLFPTESLRDLYLWQIYRYVRVEPSQQESTQIEPLIMGPESAPLIFRKPLGRGTVIVTTFDLDPYSTDLPLRGSFLPLIRELIVNALPTEPGVTRLSVGEDPTAADTQGLATLSLEQKRLVDTTKPGVQAIANLPIEVNVSRLESLPAKADLLELAAQFQPTGAGSEPVSAALATRTSDLEEAGSRAIELAPWAALAAMLLFIAEMPLSTWLSGRKVGT